jgi:hypothetical protein
VPTSASAQAPLPQAVSRLSLVADCCNAVLGDEMVLPVRAHKKSRTAPDPIFPEIQGILLEDDGKARYSVYAAKSYESDGWAVTRYTNSRDAANELADVLAKRFECVRLYEWGHFYSPPSRMGVFTGWIAFWWSDADYVGQTPGGGMGIPYGKKRVVFYYDTPRGLH